MRRWELDLLEESKDSALVFDSVIEPADAELSRTHVDAVLGDVISPLAWTLVAPAFEHSQHTLWRLMGALGPKRDTTYRFAVRAGGHLHINVSAMRALAARMPGASPNDVDTELGLTPDEHQVVTWRDRLWYPRTGFGSARTFATLGWRLRRQRRVVRRAVGTGSNLTALSTPEIVDRIEALRSRDLANVLVPHHAIRMATKVALDRLHQQCADADLANGLMAALPELEATEPSRALLRLAENLRRTGALDESAFDAFVERFGHRGVNELDPTAPVWAEQRPQLAALVRRMGEGPALADADTRGVSARQAAISSLAERPRAARVSIAISARVARRCAVRGEQSKSEVARHVHELRRAVRELACRVVDQHPEIDGTVLSWRELRRLALHDRTPTADLASRRRELEAAATIATPAPLPSPRVLTGIAASGGRVQGHAVVVENPLDPLDDGDVLVAHATDTAWTPLFVTMRAVVTDTGQLMSHSSIVARDLGIPAVVGTGRATAVVATGDPVDVDGDRGVVTIG